MRKCYCAKGKKNFLSSSLIECRVQENDRTALVEQYRDATNELSRAKMTLVDLETLANNLRQDLQMKSNDNKRLLERIDYLERDLQQVTIEFLFRTNNSLALVHLI